jgi:hypothetical protein
VRDARTDQHKLCGQALDSAADDAFVALTGVEDLLEHTHVIGVQSLRQRHLQRVRPRSSGGGSSSATSGTTTATATAVLLIGVAIGQRIGEFGVCCGRPLLLQQFLPFGFAFTEKKEGKVNRSGGEGGMPVSRSESEAVDREGGGSVSRTLHQRPSAERERSRSGPTLWPAVQQRRHWPRVCWRPSCPVRRQPPRSTQRTANAVR